MRHVRCAASRRSIRVGTCLTGVERYAPPYGDAVGWREYAGSHEGTHVIGAPGKACHFASFLLSHPHPGPLPVLSGGLSPVNPSSVCATRSRWDPHEGTGPSSK